MKHLLRLRCSGVIKEIEHLIDFFGAFCASTGEGTDRATLSLHLFSWTLLILNSRILSSFSWFLLCLIEGEDALSAGLAPVYNDIHANVILY